MPLTDEQLRSYRDQGFVIVEHFFDDREIKGMLVELERLKQARAGRNLARKQGENDNGAGAMNLQIAPLSTVSPLFQTLPFEPRVIEVVTQCIGQPFVRQLDQIFAKPGGHGVGTPWHQDNGYFNISDATKALSMWTALHDATRANGTLEVVPRSHLMRLPHDPIAGSEHGTIQCHVDESLAVPVEVKAGGVIFFNYGIAHRTGPNRTDWERAGLAFHFLRNDAILADKDPNIYVHVTGPTATNGVREYGRPVAGRWSNEIDKLLNT